MAYMEEQEYIHNDIKADNILVDSNGDVKIGDFGLARKLNGDYWIGKGMWRHYLLDK